MSKRSPIHALQVAVFARLTDATLGISSAIATSRVFDDVPDGQSMPYVEIGGFESEEDETKGSAYMTPRTFVHIWSLDRDMEELNTIADEIYQSLTTTPTLDLSADNFAVVDTYPKLNRISASKDLDEVGQIARHGVMEFDWIIQDVSS